MQTYRHYHNLLEDTDAINTVISVAELLRSEAEGEGDAKTSMNSFLNMLQNAGLNINYDGLKAYYDSDPRLQAEIQDFNEKEVVFVGDDAGLDMKPQGEVSPEKKVNSMAKSALAKRESIEEMDNLDSQTKYSEYEAGEEEDNPVVNAISGRIMRQRVDLLRDHGLDKVMQAIDEVAEFVGDVEEIGSSDISGWIKHVEQMLTNMEESVKEGYYEMPPMDRERYTDLPGLEGPFTTRSGKVVYYDPKEGKYYDRDSDMYLSYEEFKDYDQSRASMGSKMELPKGVEKESVEETFDYWQGPESIAKLAGLRKPK